MVVVWRADGKAVSPVAVAWVVLVASPVEDVATVVAHVIAAVLAVTVTAVDEFGKLAVELVVLVVPDYAESVVVVEAPLVAAPVLVATAKQLEAVAVKLELPVVVLEVVVVVVVLVVVVAAVADVEQLVVVPPLLTVSLK